MIIFYSIILRYLTRSEGGGRLPKLSKYLQLLLTFLYAIQCVRGPYLLSKLTIAYSNSRGPIRARTHSSENDFSLPLTINELQGW